MSILLQLISPTSLIFVLMCLNLLEQLHLIGNLPEQSQFLVPNGLRIIRVFEVRGNKTCRMSTQLQKLKKVSNKNQQRCLNSEPFSRKRAYLCKQKCQQKMIAIEEHPEVLNESKKMFDEQRQKFNTQQIKKLARNPNEFDSANILKQLDHVNLLIGAIQSKNIPVIPTRTENKCRVKTSYSTRTDSVNSPNSIDSQGYKIFKKPTNNIRCTQISSRPKSQSKTHETEKLKVSEDKRMLKIKSNKIIIKVYNPFPTSMSEFI